jgi:decaprenylphospho-beta-D-ribofuranose 2-oxidase
VQLAQDFANMNRRVVESYANASTPASLPEAEWLTVHSYSGIHSLQTELHRARSLRNIVATLVTARKQGRTVAVRGAGLSFDTQSMHSDLTISLDGFNEIRVDREANTMTVGAGAPWGDVVAKLEPLGLIPGNVVSGREITVGGTVSVNAMSRFTPVWGKEGKWVLSLDVLTVGGERITVSRTQEPDLFYGMIGGMGQLAILLSVTYRLQPVGTPLRVESMIERYASGDRLAPALLVRENPAKDARTSYAVVAFKGDEVRSIVTRSRYVNDLPLRPCLPHRPTSATRVPIELAIHHFQSMGQAFWNFAYEHYLDDRPYVDELLGYTFFMDGNLRTKRAAETVGIPFRTVQQCYVIPREEQVAPFIARSRTMVDEAGLELALVDVLYLPKDEPFPLSSSYGLAGFAITLTFEGLESIGDLGRARELMVDLATESMNLGGRVHLTKNVFIRHGEMSRMYAKGIEQMVAVKKRYDPRGLLTSDFAQRLFPELQIR